MLNESLEVRMGSINRFNVPESIRRVSGEEIDRIKARLADDVAAFLARGGKIQQIPPAEAAPARTYGVRFGGSNKAAELMSGGL